MPCGFSLECQSVMRAPSDTPWRASEHQRDSRDFSQPLLPGALCGGSEGSEAAPRQQRHLSFIGEGVVSAERRDICRGEGGDIYRQNSATDSSDGSRRASTRY